MVEASGARGYSAACPNCGAPVRFASAASASAVCSFCRSTLVRDGEALRRIGVVSELFDDHSPLQLGAGGTRQGIAFTLIGRLQYGYAQGTWNEWHALFDNGPDGQRSAWLSEDNGAYVLAFDAPLPADLQGLSPTLDTVKAGGRLTADGRAWDVASVQTAKLISAEGELPSPPRLQGQFTVADLRNPAGEVATLDGSDPQRIGWSVGRSVRLAELAMQGLRQAAEKTLGARGVECPNCGAALQLTLATTQSIVCHQCASVVDVSGGVGADLKFYRQHNAGTAGAEPQIALGSTGRLALMDNTSDQPGAAPLTWQAVGYLERRDIPEDAEDETSYWREYLLYHPTAGFAFLVDTNEGWSWVRPITGAPQTRGDRAEWLGVSYQRRWQYGAINTWVQGEFYWRVSVDERARVADYEGTGANRNARLSREQTPQEVTWSAGRTLDAAVVADAFNIAPSARKALQRDVAPVSFSGSGAKVAWIVFALVAVLVVMLSQCSDDSCDDLRSNFGSASNEYRQCMAGRGSGGAYRSGGGAYGGWSSGGGHK
ncbi:MAG: DUF4178 domain-containing protein [Pseudomonadota bacterium]|nr:DUF4178 domain-containing protein [Pseudomonadota bacterium]